MSIYQMIYKLGKKLQGDTFDLTYGREILRNWALRAAQKIQHTPRILDIGCGKGYDILNIQKSLGQKCELSAVEGYEEYRQLCISQGIDAQSINIERQRLPWSDGHFDVVLINQVLEHTKDCYFVISEIHRVLKPGGFLLVGVPNLGAWHDRLAVLLGDQPSCIKVPGPHVRAFTIPGFKTLIERQNFFRVRQIAGSGFLPFPRAIAVFLARKLPSLATSCFFMCQKTDKEGSFIQILDERMYETDYFRGD